MYELEEGKLCECTSSVDFKSLTCACVQVARAAVHIVLAHLLKTTDNKNRLYYDPPTTPPPPPSGSGRGPKPTGTRLPEVFEWLGYPSSGRGPSV